MKKTLLVILLSLCISFVGCGSQSNNTDGQISKTENKKNSEKTKAEESNEKEAVEETSVEDSIVSFINEFNDNSNNTLELVEDFVPSDKSSSHYRTEFRLGAYKNALGKSYSYSNAIVDFVARKDYSGNVVIRIYMDNATLEQCVEMVRIGSPIMDATITEKEIQETVDYITENKEANGYYYADLGLGLLGNDTKGYELMLKMGND